MNKAQELKQRLIEIIKNDYAFPDDMDANVLADETKEALASTDGDLRDRLALGVLCSLISSGKLTDEKCRSLLHELISDEYLLCGLGKECDDSVFARSFSTYPISTILEHNRKVDRRILTDDETKNVLDAALKYMREENDLRGFVDDKGWANSIGHAADFFASLAEDPAFGHAELLTMLNTIRDKVCIDYACYGHDIFRLRSAVLAILKRGLISEQEFANWVAEFLKHEKTGDYMKDARLAANRSEFFWGLSHGLKKALPNFYPYTFNAYFEIIQA